MQEKNVGKKFFSAPIQLKKYNFMFLNTFGWGSPEGDDGVKMIKDKNITYTTWKRLPKYNINKNFWLVFLKSVFNYSITTDENGSLM